MTAHTTLLGPMSDIAFLITSQYQINHYRPIAKALPVTPTFVIETRDQDFGVDAAFVHDHLPDVPIETLPKENLPDLDGMHRVIVCQTPVLPRLLLDSSLVVAQQYSLAKEAYQYGVWRSLVSTNLMYGEYSAKRVGGFCHAQVTGNPMFDGYFGFDRSDARGNHPLRILYLPTYGSLSSLPSVRPHLGSMGCEVLIKLHYVADPAELGDLPDNCTSVGPEADPTELLASVDAVLTDYSGAAFDALYARTPLLLTGAADPSGEDYHRLSSEDLEREVLAPLSEVWDSAAPIDEQVEKARHRLDDASYEAFRDRFFANHGSAGGACAAAIVDVLEHGEQLAFGHRQVRHHSRELLGQVRELQERNSTLQATNDRLRSGASRSFRALARSVYRRVRPRVARYSPSLERRLVGLARSVRDTQWRPFLGRRLKRGNKPNGAPSDVPAVELARDHQGKDTR